MSLPSSKTRRYCHHCHTRHGFQRDCHEINKELSMMTQKASKNPSPSRKRKHGDIQVEWSNNDHDPVLINNKSDKSDKSRKHHSQTVKQTDQTAKQTCPVCLEVRGKQQLLGCGHGLCPDCYQGIIDGDGQSRCPLCRAAMFRGESCSYQMKRLPSAKKVGATGNNRHLFGFRPVRYQLSARRPVEETDSDDDSEYDEYDEYDQYDEESEREFLQNMAIGDRLILNEALPFLQQWKLLGGDLISHEMESVADCLNSKDYHPLHGIPYGEYLAKTHGITMSQEQAVSISELVAIWDSLYSVDPPEDPYSRYGLIIGELRRIFGYASWVTQVDVASL